MSRVPRIRFKGFEEDWEQRKFIDIAETRRGLTYKPNDICEDGIRVLRSSNINEDTFVKGEDDVFVDRKAINIPFVQNGDILITSANGSSRLVGKHAIISKITDNSAVHGGFMLLATAKNPQFLNAAMGASWYIKFINLFVAGGNGAIGNLNKNDLDEQTILVPYENEQELIGHFFENFDHLITLHQRKLEKLKTIKKSMLENLFPQNGEKTPKIRFSGFTEDWEQRKLGEYLIQYTEVTIINDQYPVLTSSRKGIFFQKDYYDGNQIASENNIGYNIVPYGYFTYRHMSDDEIFYFNINNIIDNGIVSTLYPVFTTNNRLDSKFLQYELNFGKEFRKYSVLQKQGGSRTYMYFNKLRDLKLTITTSLKEQECIRNLICSIDHLITLHQSKLEKLQKIKKSMLESMFV